MMNDEQLALAQRLAAHPRFELRAGMLMRTRHGLSWRVTFILVDGTIHFATGGHAGSPIDGALVMDQGDCPDLTGAVVGGALYDMLLPGPLKHFFHVGDVPHYVDDVPHYLTPRNGGRTLAEARASALLEEWARG